MLTSHEAALIAEELLETGLLLLTNKISLSALPLKLLD